ncbi:MAG TPA: hypothetical protein VN667_16210 [Burkholderiales bacterium]|nr:hypothetical protein [Burkholderiales bacterium]
MSAQANNGAPSVGFVKGERLAMAKRIAREVIPAVHPRKPFEEEAT